MQRIRSYIAWIMLVATMATAMPRTWVHDCNNGWDEHQLHGQAGSHDQIEHENCPICDFAPTSSVQPLLVLQLTAPTDHSPQQTTFTSILSNPILGPQSQRGPPAA